MATEPGSIPETFSERILHCLKAPGHGADTDLELQPDGLRCTQTGDFFPHVDGVPSLYGRGSSSGVQITDKVRSFYEENPFPSYEGLEDFGSIVTKGKKNTFSKRLLEAIGFNKLVLECGCGTGQLSHFLQLNNNSVLGVDMSVNSLRLAIDHKNRNQLVRSNFAQMNIFELAIKDDSFDVVIVHGVLHHTYDARQAFRHIIRKVKPGGFVVVGLYHRFGRIPSWVRARLIRIFGPGIDRVARSHIDDEEKSKIWIRDQYFNPHESWHSIGEVLRWFKENDVQFLNCVPPILGTNGEMAEELFAESNPGTRYQRIVSQLSWMATIAREGAVFDMIGRRRKEARGT